MYLVESQVNRVGYHVAHISPSSLYDHLPQITPGEISSLPVTMGSQTVSASIWLSEVVNWDGKSPDIDRVLATAFGAEDYLDCVRNLQARGIDPLSYINSLDRVCTRSVSTR